MRHLLLLLSTIIFCSLANAQVGSISGTVTDNKGLAVPGASVVLKELQRFALSDGDGRYQISNIPYGTYTLEVSSMLTELKAITVSLNEASAVADVKVEEKGSIKLQEVKVARKSEKRVIEEKGFAVNVIETKGADLQSIQTNELLDRSAGVRIRQNGGLGSQIQYNINGLSGNSVRILIDGVPVSNYGESFSLNSIPAALIDRIEVYKGVVPTHLADDALGGAINIVLKESLRNTLSTSYSLGSFNTHQWNMTGSFRDLTSKFTARAAGFYNYSDNSYQVWGDKVYVVDAMGKREHLKTKRFNDGYESRGGKVDFGFTDLKWADQIMLGVVYSDMYKEVQNGATMEAVYNNRRYNQNTFLYNLNYAKRNLLINGLDLSVFASFSDLGRSTIDTVPYIFNWRGEKVVNGTGYARHSSGAQAANPTLQELDERKFATRSVLSYALNSNHKIVATYLIDQLQRDQDDPYLATFQRDLMDTRHVDKGILGLTYELTALSNKIRANLFYKRYHLGVRLKDPIRVSGSGASAVYEQQVINRSITDDGYGLAASYTLVPGFMLMGSVERAVRLPNSQELLGNDAEMINPSYNLLPENSLNSNLGVNLGPFYFGEHRFTSNINFFIRDVKDMIRQGVPTEQSETYSFENLENVISRGFDAELGYVFKNNLQVNLNASVFNGRFNREYRSDGAKYDEYGNRLRNEPYFTQNSNVKYNLNNVIQNHSRTLFYYNLSYVHEFYRQWGFMGGTGKTTIPTQLTQDLGFAHTFPNKKIVLSFDAKNIFDKQVFDNWALQKAGRSFYAKINYIIR